MFSQADILSLAILCLLLAYLHLLVLSTLFSPKTLLLSTQGIYQPKLAFKFLKYNSVVHQYNFHLLYVNVTQSHCIPGTLANTANDLSNFFCFPPISTVFCLRHPYMLSSFPSYTSQIFSFLATLYNDNLIVT